MSERNSLGRMLAVLDLFTEDRLEWSPEDLMDQLGYSRPTLYRYLKTLRENGLLTALPNTRFALGPKIVEMDYLLRRSDPLVLEGQKYLSDLIAQFPSTAFLVRWYRDKVLCVLSERSVPTQESSYPRGRPMPIGKGATARAILAFLPRRQMLSVVEEHLDEFRATGQGDSVEEILDRLKLVRRAGYAIAKGEVTPGRIGIAAPVFDSARTPIASLCVTISEERVNDETIAEIVAAVLAASGDLSAKLTQQRVQNATYEFIQ